MNVLIIEQDGQTIKKLSRVIKAIDNSIHIQGVLRSFGELPAWLVSNHLPHLVLIHQLVAERNLSMQKRRIDAKLILTIGNHHLTYLAFRPAKLIQLHEQLSSVMSTEALSRMQQGENLLPKPFIHTNFGKQVHKNRFLVMQSQKFLSIPVKDIAYFFSEDKLVFFQTYSTQKYLVEYRMEELEVLIDPRNFFRINRSYIISIDCIVQIHPYFGNRLKLELNPKIQNEIIVSRERVGSFKTWLGE